jgi:hypothetical protein
MALMLCISYFIVAAPEKAQADDRVTPGAVTWAVPLAGLGQPFDPSGGTPWATMGYSQAEYLMSGTANVYENISNTGFGIQTRAHQTGIPYTTRVLIRYPSNVANFSGNVVVEFINPSGTFDLATAWDCFWPQIIHDNDIWVGLTCRYVVVDSGLPYHTGLQKFDPVRYAALNFSGHERELAWDMYAQLGYALKHSHNLPAALSGFTASHSINHLIGHGYSQTGGYMITWINFFDPYFIADLYDAYNPMAAGGPVWMNDDDIATDLGMDFDGNPTTDARRIIQPCSKPVIHINTESEVNMDAVGSFLSPVITRRPDANTSTDKFRHYDIPGGCHINAQGFANYPPLDQIAQALGTSLAWCCVEDQSTLSDFPQGYVFDAAYANLKTWMLGGAAPPSEISLSPANGGFIPLTLHVIQRDLNGNALGGVRTPWVDFPVKTYYPAMTACPTCGLVCSAFAFFCPLYGKMSSLCARIGILYTGAADYNTKFNTETDTLTTAKWFSTWEQAAIKANKPAFPDCNQGAPSASVVTANGSVSFSINGGGITGLANIPASSLPCSAGGYIFPFGMFSYSIVGLTPGATSYVTIRVTTAVPMGAKFFKCQNGNLVDFTQYVQQPDPFTFILTLKDGGQGDADGLANGTIVDPCGPAFLDTSNNHRSSPQVPTVVEGPAAIANIAVQSASLSTAKVAPGAPVTITANVANKGTANGSTQIKLYVNGQEEANQGVTLSSGSRTPVKFTVSRDEPGTYSVYVGSIPAGTFEVDRFADPNIILYISGALLLFAMIGGVIFMANRRR